MQKPSYQQKEQIKNTEEQDEKIKQRLNSASSDYEFIKASEEKKK